MKSKKIYLTFFLNTLGSKQHQGRPGRKKKTIRNLCMCFLFSFVVTDGTVFELDISYGSNIPYVDGEKCFFVFKNVFRTCATKILKKYLFTIFFLNPIIMGKSKVFAKK